MLQEFFFCDLAGTFYCVDHELLLQKLQFYAVRRVTLDWFKSYSFNRKQRVELNSSMLKIALHVGYLSNMGSPSDGIEVPCFLTYI